jgi:hypothetical protein
VSDQVSVAKVISKGNALTHGKVGGKIKPVKFRLLEFEDVLFHHDSAVMMPDDPAGVSSQQGGGSSQSQRKVSGVKALALVFKQFEFNPDQKIIVAGHTDTSGGPELNFTLSDLRAKSVLYLLTGQRDDWADVSFSRQKIEDYQQVLKHMAVTRKWNFCDPGNIDDKWGPKTQTAVERYVLTYNAEFASKHNEVKRLQGSDAQFVAGDGKHRWNKDLWKAAFSLYIDELCSLMKVTLTELDSLRKDKLKFISDDSKLAGKGAKRFVGCGESFPLDAVGKDDYKSQKNRRVEIVFFDADDAPVIDCPLDRKAVHKKEQCPLWHDYHIRTHLDANDLYAVMYHISFRYFNSVENAMKDVPDGLVIKVFEFRKGNANPVEVPAVVEHKAGVYSVKAQFTTALNDPDREGLYFEFKKPTGKDDMWVYTKDKGQTPEIVYKKRADVAKLALPERLKYYDLPSHWSSRNYWARYNGKWDTGDLWEEVAKKLKPFGSDTTQPKSQLIFSLDDIVLINSSGHQTITDKKFQVEYFEITKSDGSKERRARIINEADTPVSDKSRLSMLYVKDTELTLHNPEDSAKQPYFTKFQFKKKGANYVNLVYDIPQDGQVRLVAFCNQFYHAFDKRAEVWNDPADQFDPAKHVVGCRAATLGDTAWYVRETFSYAAGTPAGHDFKYYAADTGNFELHYLHDACVIPKKDGLTRRAFLIIHWSCICLSDWDHPLPAVAPATAPYDGLAVPHTVTPPLDAKHDKAKFMATEALLNTKKRWEEKGYTIEPLVTPVKATDCDIQIVPYFYLEARQSGLGGAPKCAVQVSDAENPNWMASGNALLYWKNYEAVTPDPVGKPNEDRYGVPGTDKVDGKSVKAMTIAHELGHAKGKDDEYEYEDQFTQYYPGMPYHYDGDSMMLQNRLPRLKQLWGFVNWINDAAKTPTPPKVAPLNTLLGATAFKLVYRIASAQANMPAQLNYHLKDTYRKIYTPFATENVSTGNAALPLSLYKLGDDEGAYNIRVSTPTPPAVPRSFDGILVVSVRVNIRFTPFTDGAGTVHNWTAANKRDWIKGVRDKILEFNGHFYFRHTSQDTAHDFKNTYLYFFPVVGEPSASDRPLGTEDYLILVTKDGTNTISVQGSKNIRCGDLTEKLAVVRYIFGQNDATFSAGIRRVFGFSERTIKQRLVFTETWFKSKMIGGGLNRDFTFVGEYPYPP